MLVIMTFNSATILLARCLGVALLLQVAMSYLFGILGAEMGIYLAYKVLMGDFYITGCQLMAPPDLPFLCWCEL